MNILIPILVQLCDDLFRGGREVPLHHVDEGCARPVRIRLAEEVRDGHGVLLPFGVGTLLTGLVAGLRSLDQVDRDRDVHARPDDAPFHCSSPAAGGPLLTLSSHEIQPRMSKGLADCTERRSLSRRVIRTAWSREAREAQRRLRSSRVLAAATPARTDRGGHTRSSRPSTLRATNHRPIRTACSSRRPALS